MYSGFGAAIGKVASPQTRSSGNRTKVENYAACILIEHAGADCLVAAKHIPGQADSKRFFPGFQRQFMGMDPAGESEGNVHQDIYSAEGPVGF